MSDFGKPGTKAAAEMVGKVHIENKPLLTDGQTNPRLPSEYDHLYLSSEEYKEYGINPETEVHCWIRNPNYWAQHEAGDRAAQFRREYPGRRVILQDGQFVTNGRDLILAVKSRAEVEADERLQRAETAEFEQNAESGEIPGARPPFRGVTQADFESIRASHRENIASGIIGETKGMSWEHVRRMKGPEAVAAEEAFHRNGGRHVTAPDDEGAFEEFAQTMAEANRGRRSYAMGDNGRLRDESGRLRQRGENPLRRK